MSVRRLYKVICILTIFCSAVMLGTPSVKANDQKQGSLVVIGGAFWESGESIDKIYEKIVELSGGNEGKIGVITSSRRSYEKDCEINGESENGGCNDPKALNSKMLAQRYIDRFESYGINAEWIPVDTDHTEIADDESWAESINQGEYSGFMLGGGSQWRH